MQQMMPEIQEFSTIYGYHLPTFFQTTQGIVVLVGCMIVVAAVVGYLLWRHWFAPQPVTLAMWAEKEVRALRSELARTPVNYKLFFGAATFFVKQYLFRVYGWPLLDKTDEEVKGFVEDKQEISKKLKQQFEEMFSYAQMVKFADKAALHERAEDTMRIVVQVVKEVSPPADDVAGR